MKTYHHIVFWSVVYGSLTLLLADWFNGYSEAFYYVSLLMPVVMGTSYFFNYFLVPRYLFRKKFFQFGLYTFYLLVVSLCLELLAGIAAMLLMIYYGINANGVLVTDVFTLAVIMYFVVLVKSFILLIRHYYRDQSSLRDMERRQAQAEAEAGYFTVRSNRRQTRVAFTDVRYIESLSDYIRIHLDERGAVTTREKISHIENNLPGRFLRIHRSFIVNTSKITSYSRETVRLGDRELPVSRTYRKQVAEVLQRAGM